MTAKLLEIMSDSNEFEGEIPVKDIALNKDEQARLCVYCGKTLPTTTGLKVHQKWCKMNNERILTKNSGRKASLICVHCGKTFAFRSGLSRHERFCKQDNSPMYKCQVCSSSFSRIDNFRNHTSKCTSDSPSNLKVTRRTQCLYENCSAVFFHKSKLTLHLKKFHNSKIEEEQLLEFKNLDEFLMWKHSEEERTHSCFTKNSGTKRTTVYYHCQHDGSSKPHCKVGMLPRKTVRKVKKGLVKQGKTCLARLTLRLCEDGSCKVTYQPTHSHKLNIRDYHKSPLLTETVKFINHQLAMGVPPKDCFKDLYDGSFTRNSKNSSIQECQPVFISGTDAVYRPKRMKMRNNKDDSISVMIRTVLLSKEKPNPIIVYKPLGSGKIIGPKKIDKLRNTKNLFMLGIQTEEQRNVMLIAGKSILSVDVTDDTNAYGYPLLTLLVRDEHNRGYPVGFFISSNMDYGSISCFFLALKLNCPDIYGSIINYIVTPQNQCLLDSLQETLHIHVSYIWCLWGVHKDFQHHLLNLVPENLLQDMYNCLCLIIECKDQIILKELIEQFIAEYSISCPEFVTYFQDHYMHKLDKWTIAHRNDLHGGVDTTVFNEAIHNRIKIDDFNEPHERRLDDLLNILLDLEDNYYRTRVAEGMLGVPIGVGDVALCHSEGLEIPDSNVIQVHDTLWEVKPTKGKQYEVIKCSDSCTVTTCYYICNTVPCKNLCSHKFACTCTDRNPLCKHIHKVQELICRQELPVRSNCSTTNKVRKSSGIIKNFDATKQNKYANIGNYLAQLSVFINKQEVANELLDRMESSLADLVAECQVLVDEQEIHTTPYEFEYQSVEVTKTEYPSPDPSDVLFTPIVDISPCSPCTFTPAFDFANIDEIVLKCGIEELSFLQLKSLDPFLAKEEMAYLREHNCRKEWMYPGIVNAFFNQLQSNHSLVSVINSDFAFVLARSQMSNVFCLQNLLEKEILIMPMNLSYKYWTCVAIFIQKREIIYFNSKEKMSKVDEMAIKNLQLLIDESVYWKVIYANYDFQNDGINCGAQICNFSEQIAMEKNLAPLIDVHSYRKHIYETIVGRCLKRNHYRNTVCGSCNEFSCLVVNDETANLSICCDRCNQWFHIHCIGLQTMDTSNMRFTCPV